jgi:hypothetical protein
VTEEILFMMDTTPNTIEFTMKKKTDAKILLMRLGIVSGCILIPVLIISFFLRNFVFASIPILGILSVYAGWFLMRFTAVEYEFTIVGGEFSVAAIYDNRSRKDLINAVIKDMHRVAPLKSNEHHLEAKDIEKIFYYCSDMDNPDLYFCVFDDKKLGRTAVVFNSTRKFIQIMKFYNALNVELKKDFLI